MIKMLLLCGGGGGSISPGVSYFDVQNNTCATYSALIISLGANLCVFLAHFSAMPIS